MRRRIAAVCLALMILALLLVVTGRSGTSAQEAAAVAQRRLVEVGKTYHFLGPRTDTRCKVVEAPRDKWVCVDFLNTAKPTKGWINLDLVSVIWDEE